MGGRGDTSVLSVTTGESGTYVIGVSLRPRELRLDAKDFNDYLAHDGLPDVLEARRNGGELDRPALERYSKHVKALVQVGDRRTEGYRTVLGYPAELIPLDNPYTMKPGRMIRLRALVGGEPVVNQLVIAGGPRGTAICSDGQRGCCERGDRVWRRVVRQVHSHAPGGGRHHHRLRV